jgi:acyl-CoA thioester hydrolase
MMKIVIEYPEKTVFTCQTHVRITDLGPSGHVGFDSFVAIINDASAQFFEQPEIRKKAGRIGRIYADLAISYKTESFFGDTLRIDMAIGETSDKGFDMMFRILSAHTGKIAALAKIGVLFFDYETHQVTSIPEGILEIAGVQGPAVS